MSQETSNEKPVVRAWQRMLSGRRLDLLNPSPLDVEIEDIAHGLARVARWNGQTLGTHAFSVAEHSLLVEEITGVLKPDWPARWQLAALLHDAPEYVVGDLISPFKAAIGLDYKALEQQLLAAIHTRFGLQERLPSAISKTIKTADKYCAYFEAVHLAGFTTSEAKKYFGEPVRLDDAVHDRMSDLDPKSAADAQSAFLDRFKELLQACD